MAESCSFLNRSLATSRSLLFLDLLGQLLADVFQRHVAGRDLALALEDRELLADRDDRRNLVRLQGKHLLLDGRVADVVADRLDQPADARAVDVLGMLHGQAGEVVRAVRQLAVELFGELRGRSTTISRHFTAGPNCASYAS